MGTISHKAPACAGDSDFDADEIAGCAEGSLGAGLEVAAAKETASLSPKHNFVPWMVINGVAIGM